MQRITLFKFVNGTDSDGASKTKTMTVQLTDVAFALDRGWILTDEAVKIYKEWLKNGGC